MDLAGDDGPDDVGDDAFEGPSSLAADAKNAEVGGEPVEGKSISGFICIRWGEDEYDAMFNPS